MPWKPSWEGAILSLFPSKDLGKINSEYWTKSIHMKSHAQVKGSQYVLLRSKKHVLKSHQHFDMNEDLSGAKIHHLVEKKPRI